MSRVRALALVSAACVVAGCARGPSFDPVAEQQKLLQRDAEWSEAASQGKDVERTASYWADDPVIVPQGQPIVAGKAAIKAFVAANFQTPGFSIRWESEAPTFSPDGKLAYMRNTSTTTVPGANGAPMTLPGRGLTLWRVDPDGQWRCVVDIWNDPPSPAPPAASSP